MLHCDYEMSELQTDTDASDYNISVGLYRSLKQFYMAQALWERDVTANGAAI